MHPYRIGKIMRLYSRGPSVLALALMVLLPNAVIGQTSKPTITSVANVASYSPGPISPGEMVVIFGASMGPPAIAGMWLNEQNRVATTISEVQVLFDGIAAPLIYVSERQIAAMVPYGLSGKALTQVQVVYKGIASDAAQKPIASTAPGIFTANAAGRGQAAMTNADGSLNSSTNPAAPGSFVTFYVTGEGEMDPPGSDGNVAAMMAKVKSPATVRIAGRTAQVLYAGSAPGNVNGFCQINAVIPADLEYGGSLPLSVQLGATSSQAEVTVAVSGPPAPVPGTPLNLSVAPNSSGHIVLTWNPMDVLATRFHLERRVATEGSFAEIATIPASATTFSDEAATSGVAYQYRLRAENEWGFSGYSTTVNGTIPAAQMLPPSDLNAVAVSQAQINLWWNRVNTNATRFHIERKTGAAGTYSEIAIVPNTATTFQDSAVQPNTTYTYRMRSEGASGLSGYSTEVLVTTPAVQLPPAAVLQAAVVSSSQVRLTWAITATGILRFRLERRAVTGTYTEIGQPGATARSFDDSGLNASTTYVYRVRVETGVGMSPYSNEVTATTLQALPAAPTSLRATATSSIQVTLTWTNNAPDATVIRVESRPAGGAATFSDIGPAYSLTSTGLTNLAPNTTYTFRVRAQNAAGYSGYSNEVSVTTLPVPKTVFLIHGLGQGPEDMLGLAGSLNGPSGIDTARFRIDSAFDFSGCAEVNLLLCDTGCSVMAGAQKLARHINEAKPPGDIVLVGFSMGGVIARDMVANNWFGVLTNRKLAGLITLGTPNLGYPYSLPDTLVYCSALVQALDGNWRSQQDQNTIVLSPYLNSLTNQWRSTGFPGSSGIWFAASGRSCSEATRYLNPTTGCRDKNTLSDGVVCDDSAVYNVSTPTGTQPNRYWQDPGHIYVHTNAFWGRIGSAYVLCGNDGQNPTLSNPPSFGPLFAAIKGVINGL